MARPERRNADYFPFYAKDGRTLFILESKYKAKGTGFFTNVLRFLTLQENHHFQIKDESDRLYFFSKCHCDIESGIDMLNIMAKTCKIHEPLWVSYEVIASLDLLSSLSEAYRNRKNNIITIDEILSIYKEEEAIKVSSDRNGVSSAGNPQVPVINSVEKPQRKGKERKVNKEPPSGDFLKNKNHVYFKSIETSCLKLLKLPRKKDEKPFNPCEFMNWAINTEECHHGAVDYTLQALVKYAQKSGINDLFGYGRKILKTANGNFCEKDHIEDYKVVKKEYNEFLAKSTKIQTLLKGLFV